MEKVLLDNQYATQEKHTLRSPHRDKGQSCHSCSDKCPMIPRHLLVEMPTMSHTDGAGHPWPLGIFPGF